MLYLYVFLMQGSTQLTVLPLTATGKLWRLYLNCKQCRILSVMVNGTLNANFSYVDPTLSICPPDTKKWDLSNIHVCINFVLMFSLHALVWSF